jgi:hypothetical protein
MMGIFFYSNSFNHDIGITALYSTHGNKFSPFESILIHSP